MSDGPFPGGSWPSPCMGKGSRRASGLAAGGSHETAHADDGNGGGPLAGRCPGGTGGGGRLLGRAVRSVAGRMPQHVSSQPHEGRIGGMPELLGLLFGAFLITGLVSRLARLPLRSRTDDKTRSVVACVITVLLSFGISTYKSMGLAEALLAYVPTSLAWLLIDLHRARKSAGVTPAATDNLSLPRTGRRPPR